jgi:ABC-2 type transport system permease protein
MGAFMILAKALTRILAFLGKELVEVARRPGALMSLILGPFLIMAIFGIGYSGFKRPLNTIVVVPSSTGLPTDPAYYENIAGAGIKVVQVAETDSGVDQQLHDGAIDLAVIAPPDTQEKLQAGQQSVIEVRVDASDPLDGNYAVLMADQVSDHVNRELIRRAAEQGQAQLGPQAGQIPPEVIAAPTKAEVNNIAPIQPTVVQYFGPAVLALILQHMAVSLIALSVIRERTTGMIELFRISPVSAWEIVSGKIIGFGALGGAIAALTIALLVLGLNVPNLGSGLLLAGVVALLILASLGLGMLIALVSDSERQTVQLSLLVLLASIFFSGFVLPLTEFSPPVAALARVIPVTNGIELLQDVMFRGVVREPWQAGVLAATAGVLLVGCWLLLRRGMSRA